MAVKKPATRKRSTTKSTAKTARATTKRATKSKAAKPVEIEQTPTIEATEVAEATEAAEAAEAAEITEVAPPAPAVPAPPAAARAVVYRPILHKPTAHKPSGDQPSRYTGDHYLHAAGPQPENGAVRKPGKWLIFVSRSRVDALWESIRRAVEKGRLGHAAKVSTALPDPSARDPKKHVIAVYTANETDAADVRRVRDVLRGLGVTWRIPYKSDGAALAGQNDDMVGGPATKYYE